MLETQHREAAAAAQRELVVGGRLLHALGAGPGERRVGLVDGDRPAERRVGVVPPAVACRAPRGARAAPSERGGHDAPARRTARRRCPSATRRLPAGDAERDREREADARERLHQHQPAEQREALVPGQPAAREVAGGVGERADRRSTSYSACWWSNTWLTSSFVKRQRDDQEEQREARLDQHRHAQRVLGVPARAALGDRAREQLFDRPVDHRDDHEHHRPQQRRSAWPPLLRRARGWRSRSRRTSAGPSRRSRATGSARRCRRSAVAESGAHGSLEADKQHRPGERRADLDDLAVAREQLARTSAWTSG